MRRLLHHSVLFAAGCTTAWLFSWLQDEPAPMVSASPPGVTCPPSAPGDEDAELRKLRAQVEGLTRALAAAQEAEATAAARVPAPEPLRTAPPSSLPEAPSSVARPSVPEAPVEAPVAEQPAEDPAASERLAQLEQAAQAQADRAAAERAAVLTITRVHEQLSSGNLDGVSAILEEAAASLTGPAAQELRAATRSLENEDLATARQHLELALISAQ